MAKKKKDPVVKVKKLPPMMAFDLRGESSPDAKGGGSLVFKGGRVPYGRMKDFNKKDGGTLKDIPPDNKGLPKLPTDVRNKMGFKKKGGTVKAKKGKFMCAPRKLEAGAMEMPKRNGRKRGA